MFFICLLYFHGGTYNSNQSISKTDLQFFEILASTSKWLRCRFMLKAQITVLQMVLVIRLISSLVSCCKALLVCVQTQENHAFSRVSMQGYEHLSEIDT